MSNKKHQSQKTASGFTIIEVVLVLAIAGLIFLMVFVALPALQRSQRDTQRRNDMSRVDTSLVQYQTNNMSSGNNVTALPKGPSYWAACKDGNFADLSGGTCTAQTDAGASSDPTVAETFVQRYLNAGTDSTTNTFQDPDGMFYNVYITENIGDKTLAADNLTTTKGGAILNFVSGSGFTVGTEFKSHIVYIIPGGKCDGEYVKTDTPRHFAIMYRLEGAGVYCIDDQ